MRQVTMKTQVFLLLLGIGGVTAVTHSLSYIVTAATGLNKFPEHNEVGLLDGQEFVHYDSNLKKMIPKTVWIEKNTDADYWERETQRNINTEQVFQGSIGILMQRFNQTGGVHIYQKMYGCEWDDETNEVNGYRQYAYDGEDFLSFDLKMERWIAPVQQAVITKHKWDNDKADMLYRKNYLTQECPEWLKKYVNYGRSSLMRKDLPSVSLLQKTPSSPVTCHATGFYPNRADLFWMKDGEELHEDVDKGEILPNHDGTFQMSVDLKISSITPEDWKKYDCVFQLSGVKDVNTKLDKAVIRTNRVEAMTLIILIVIAVAVVTLAFIAVAGFMIYKKRRTTKDEKTSPETSPTGSLQRNSDSETLSMSSDSSRESVNSDTPLIKD